MDTRCIGRIEVPPLGLGTWSQGGDLWAGDASLGWGAVDDDESIRTIHAALDAGLTLIDTADLYGAGHGEEVLGRALVGRHADAVVITKWGHRFDPSTRGYIGEDPTPGYMTEALAGSLSRLGRDYIDLYVFHLWEATPALAEDLQAALEDLATEGTIRAYGWSTDLLHSAKAWVGGDNYAAVEHELNVLSDAPEMVGLCDSHGLASINRGPLAMGLLGGNYTTDTRFDDDTVRGRGSDWKYFEDGRPSSDWLQRLDAIRECLTIDGRTVAQGALSWLWARSPNTIPIPGSRTLAQLENSVDALEFGPLDAETLATISRLTEIEP